MAVTNQQVAELYVATFNRAPDAAGLAYWVNSGLTIEQIAQSFFDQTETQTLYPTGTTDSAFVTSIYTNLFNRAPDADGLAYWVADLAAGTSRSVMIEAMKNGALGTDATIIANKATVGLAYVAAGLEGTTFSLASVTADTATVTAAQTSIDLLVSPIQALTVGTETVTGTANNDTISGVTSSLSTAKTMDATDTIDGAAGTDTLNVTMNTSFTGFTTGSVANVENINLTNGSTVAKTFDASGITGATAYSIDATNAAITISDLSAIPSVSVTGQASGTFSTAMDATFVALAGTADAMTLNVTNVGTLDNAATTANEEATVTSTLTSMETINLNATGTNVLAFGGTATALNIAGAGDVKVTGVATTTTAINGSTSTGDITIDTTAAAANALTSVATGAGDDTITLDTADMLANGTIIAGEGADTLSLTSGAKTLQYTMTGVETVALTAVTGAVTFSAGNASGITTVSTVAANTAATSLVNMGAGDLTINAIGATNLGGNVSSTHTGATTLNYTTTAAELAAKTAVVSAADFTVTGSNSLTINQNAYIVNTGSIITAAAATAVTLNVESGMSAAATPAQVTKFDGAITAAAATSFTANINGEIDDTAAITVDAATSASITNTTTAGAMDLQAAALQTLTLSSAKAFTFKAGSDLAAVQTADITVNDGAFTGVDLDAISSLTLAGTGVTNATTGTTDSSVASINLGGNNAYNMTVLASGLKGGLALGTVDVGAAQDISIDTTAVTGAVTIGNINADGVGTAAGRNVTINAAGTAGAVNLANITGTGAVALTHSGAGTFDVNTISAGSFTSNTSGTGAVTLGTGGSITTTGALSITNASTGAFTATPLTAGVTGDVTVALDGTIGAVNLGTIAGKTVNLDVSNTIGGVASYGVITALNSATLALSELQANTIQIDAATASTAFTAAITGGIAADAITFNDVATTTAITVTGNLGTVTATDSILVDADASTAATMNINISGLTSYDTGTINVTGAAAAGTAQTIVGGAGADTITFETTDTLSSIDTVTGGAGTDILVITDAGALDADFTNVTTIETLTLGGASSVTLGTEAQAAGIVTVNDSAGIDTIDASAMTVAVAFVSTTDAVVDTYTTGTAADTIDLKVDGAIDIIKTSGGVATVDRITNFKEGNAGATGDELKLDISAIEALTSVVDMVLLGDATSTAAGVSVVTTLAATTTLDLGTAATTTILSLGATFADVAAVEAALVTGGSNEITVNGAWAVGDAGTILWTDGTDTHVSMIVTDAIIADNGKFVAANTTIEDIVVLVGTTIGSFTLDNFDTIA